MTTVTGSNEVAIRDFFSSRRLEQVFEVIRRLLTKPQGVTKSTTLTSTNTVVAVTGGSAGTTIYLPRAGDHTSRVYTIKKVDATLGSVTVDAFGLDLIDGQSVLTLANQWDSVTIISDGTQWLILNRVTTASTSTTSGYYSSTDRQASNWDETGDDDDGDDTTSGRAAETHPAVELSRTASSR